MTRTSGAPSPLEHLHVRNVLNDARTSSVKYFGCSHAAKWQPFGMAAVMQELRDTRFSVQLFGAV